MSHLIDAPCTSTRKPKIPVDGIKWGASIAQIGGYGATAFGWEPWNIYLFLVGLIGWFTVGIIWNDRAIMLIHIVALAAMVAGLLAR